VRDRHAPPCFVTPCKLGLEGIVSKRKDGPDYIHVVKMTGPDRRNEQEQSGFRIRAEMTKWGKDVRNAKLKIE
jgi:hypothetical protein